MNRDQKAVVVDEVAADIQSAEAVFAVDYRGMSVTQAADLRTRLIEANASLRVVKNTLTERAADKAGNENLKGLLEGPTALTFVNGDVALAAKAIATFRREHEIPQWKGGTMAGESLTVDQLDSIAKLPAREVLNAQLAGTIASPLTGLVRGLNALIAGIAIQLRQIADQGLVGTDGGPQTADGGGSQTADGGDEAPAAEEAAEAAEGTPAEPQATPDEQPPEPEAAAEEPAAEAEAPAEAEAEAEPEPSEAPGDPVAEAEAAEEESAETPSEGDTEEQEG